MAKSDLKTKPTKADADNFLKSVKDEQKRRDSFIILELMKKITEEPPIMWGPSIVGFGCYHYKYESGREGDWFIVGLSPRKLNLTIYIMAGLKRYESILKKLGKFKIGGGCLYIKKLEDIDLKVLKELITEAVKYIKKMK